jgi:hypothetical protein
MSGYCGWRRVDTHGTDSFWTDTDRTPCGKDPFQQDREQVVMTKDERGFGGNKRAENSRRPDQLRPRSGVVSALLPLRRRNSDASRRTVYIRMAVACLRLFTCERIIAITKMESESYHLDRVLNESRSSHSSHTAHGDTDARPLPRASIPAEGQERIVHLARRLTTQSVSRHQTNEALPNPFIDDTDPRLDPQSDQFEAARWARLFLHLASTDPERYPKRKAGVSFRSLSVSGVGNPIAYQQTFAGIIQQPLDIVFSLLHPRDRSIQILKQHDGLVRSKEMLLVLGRPGRYDSRSFLLHSGILTTATVACRLSSRPSLVKQEGLVSIPRHI